MPRAALYAQRKAKMINFALWAGGAYLKIGSITMGFRTSFEHWGWWGKAFYVWHFYGLLS